MLGSLYMYKYYWCHYLPACTIDRLCIKQFWVMVSLLIKNAATQLFFSWDEKKSFCFIESLPTPTNDKILGCKTANQHVFSKVILPWTISSQTISPHPTLTLRKICVGVLYKVTCIQGKSGICWIYLYLVNVFVIVLSTWYTPFV